MKFRFLFSVLMLASPLASCGKDKFSGIDGGSVGGGVSSPVPALILFQDFTKGMGGFTVLDKEKGGFNKAVWIYDPRNPQYGVQATASDTGVNYKAESWLVSPEIDLTEYKQSVYLYFNHAFAYVKKGVAADFFSPAGRIVRFLNGLWTIVILSWPSPGICLWQPIRERK